MNPDHVLTVYIDHLARASDGLPREVVQIAMLFDGHRRIQDVIHDSCLSDRMTVTVVNRLRNLGIIGKNGTERSQAAVRNAAAAAEGITFAPFDQTQAPTSNPPATIELPSVASPRDSAPHAAPAPEVGAAADPSLAETMQISREALVASLPDIAPGRNGANGHADTLQRALELATALPMDLPAVPSQTPQTGPSTPVESVPRSHPEAELQVAEADKAEVDVSAVAMEPRAEAEIQVAEPARASVPVADVAPAEAAVAEPPPAVEPPTVKQAAPEAFNEFEKDFFESYVPEDGTLDTFWDLEETPWRRERAKQRAQQKPRRGFFSMLLNL